MITNKRIKNVTLVLTVLALILFIFYRKDSFWFNVFLAIFGSSFLSYITARINYISELRKIKRQVVFNLLQIQKEVKYILTEYSKLLEYWDANDFYNTYNKVRGLIDEFFVMSNIIKYETGKELCECFKICNFVELYASYITLNGDIYTIGKFIEKNPNNKKVLELVKDARVADEKIVEELKKHMKKEYGKNFAEVNSISLI